MSKSSKKRRQAAKRREELDKLRGVSLLDSASPGSAKNFALSPDPRNASHLKKIGRVEDKQSKDHSANSPQEETENGLSSSFSSKERARKRVDFVLPRVLGKSVNYIFDKHAKGMLNEELAPINEEEDGSLERKKGSAKHSKESIDDILFPSKKRQLEESPEVVHRGKSPEKEHVETPVEDRKMQDKKKNKIKNLVNGASQVSKKRQLEESPEVAHRGKSPEMEHVEAPVEDRKIQDKKKNKIKNLVNGASQVSKKRQLEESPEVVHREKSTEKEHVEAPIEDRKIQDKKKNKIKNLVNGASQVLAQLTRPSKSSEEKAAKKAKRSDANHDNTHHGRLSGLSVEDAVRDKIGLRPRSNSTDGELNLPQRGLCDERMVLTAHRWNLDQIFVHETTPKGFVNLGNTCFLNATLQCLAYLPPFFQSLVTMAELKNSRHNGQKLSQGQKITSTLCELFQKVHGFNTKSAFSDAIAPQAIVRALPTIGTCGSKNGYKFRPGRQEDAHEFLVHLLDAMNDGELKGAGINQHTSGWRDRLPVPRLDETTFIHRIFGGYLRSQVRCNKCGYCSNTYDPFLDLSLEVSKKSSNSVAYAFSEFTRKETLDSANKWKCSGCKKHVCATKQLTVFRPPLTLCVQLKRFTFDGGGGARGFSAYGTGGRKYGKSNKRFGGGGKITKPIEFPAEMDLPLSDSRSCPYALTGIVIHVGGSASSGHYTSYVKKPGRKGTNQWYHVDDSFVEPVSEKTVLKQKDAYLLLYCRREVKIEFPAPPPRASMSAEEAKELGRARARARADSFSKEDGTGRKSSDDEETTSKEEQKVPPSINGHAAEKKADQRAETSKTKNPPVQRGALERVKTKIHPLASPAPPIKVARAESPKISRDDYSSSYSEDDPSDEDGKDATVPTASAESKKESPKVKSDSDESSSSDSSSSSDDNDAEEATSATSDKMPPNRMQPHTKQGKGKYVAEQSAGKQSSSEASSSSDESAEENDPIETKAGIAKKAPRSDTTSDSSSSESDEVVNERPAKKHAALGIQPRGASTPQDDSSSDSSLDSDDDEAKETAIVKTPTANRKLETAFSNAIAPGKSLQASKPTESPRTRVVLDQGPSRGKVEVMLGPRKMRRGWKPKAFMRGDRSKGSDLLGNLGVSKWDDDDGGKEQNNLTEKHASKGQIDRGRIVKEMEKQERLRKRKMHLDRWDALLDQGKVSKKTCFINRLLCFCSLLVLNMIINSFLPNPDKEDEIQKQRGGRMDRKQQQRSKEKCIPADSDGNPKNEPRQSKRIFPPRW
jgi:ubiquitin C-terminal hydrolase